MGRGSCTSCTVPGSGWGPCGSAKRTLIQNPGATKHSKHIERWVMFARDAFLHNRAKFLLTGTANMMADSLTKVTDRTKFYKCRDYMMNA